MHPPRMPAARAKLLAEVARSLAGASRTPTKGGGGGGKQRLPRGELQRVRVKLRTGRADLRAFANISPALAGNLRAAYLVLGDRLADALATHGIYRVARLCRMVRPGVILRTGVIRLADGRSLRLTDLTTRDLDQLLRQHPELRAWRPKGGRWNRPRGRIFRVPTDFKAIASALTRRLKNLVPPPHFENKGGPCIRVDLPASPTGQPRSRAELREWRDGVLAASRDLRKVLVLYQQVLDFIEGQVHLIGDAHGGALAPTSRSAILQVKGPEARGLVKGLAARRQKIGRMLTARRTRGRTKSRGATAS